jgi:hypothetical protein
LSAVFILSGLAPPEQRMAFCADWSWSQRGRANEGQGPEKIIPGGEHKKRSDDPQRLEEALARHQFAHGRAPFATTQLTDGMTGEGQQVQDG